MEGGEVEPPAEAPGGGEPARAPALSAGPHHCPEVTVLWCSRHPSLS